MSEARIGVAHGSHGDIYVVSDGGGTVSISADVVRRFVLDQLALQAPATVELRDGGHLTVYMKRDASGAMAADDGLAFEFGGLPCKLNSDEALKLSRVLIAYAVIQSPHTNWLVRKESGQG